MKDTRASISLFSGAMGLDLGLLQAGVDISTIAIWLGHENIETTHKYMVADIEIKRQAMEKLDETTNNSFNYKPSKSILAFLASL